MRHELRQYRSIESILFFQDFKSIIDEVRKKNHDPQLSHQSGWVDVLFTTSTMKPFQFSSHEIFMVILQQNALIIINCDTSNTHLTMFSLSLTNTSLTSVSRNSATNYQGRTHHIICCSAIYRKYV